MQGASKETAYESESTRPRFWRNSGAVEAHDKVNEVKNLMSSKEALEQGAPKVESELVKMIVIYLRNLLEEIEFPQTAPDLHFQCIGQR